MIVRFTRRARRDINNIFDHIAPVSLNSAERVIRRIDERCLSLATFPERGLALTLEGRTHLRRVIEGRHLIVYRVDPGTVWIVAVIHGARDLGNALADLDSEG